MTADETQRQVDRTAEEAAGPERRSGTGRGSETGQRSGSGQRGRSGRRERSKTGASHQADPGADVTARDAREGTSDGRADNGRDWRRTVRDELADGRRGLFDPDRYPGAAVGTVPMFAGPAVAEQFISSDFGLVGAAALWVFGATLAGVLAPDAEDSVGTAMLAGGTALAGITAWSVVAIARSILAGGTTPSLLLGVAALVVFSILFLAGLFLAIPGGVVGGKLQEWLVRGRKVG